MKERNLLGLMILTLLLAQAELSSVSQAEISDSVLTQTSKYGFSKQIDQSFLQKSLIQEPRKTPVTNSLLSLQHWHNMLESPPKTRSIASEARNLIFIASDLKTMMYEYQKALLRPSDPKARIIRCRLGEQILNAYGASLDSQTNTQILMQLDKDRCYG